MPFSQLGLSAPIVQAIEEKGYTEPSPIQAAAIPAVLQGQDVMAAAQTGTGKTAGFTLPILELLSRGPAAGSNQARALILTPTRELAAQIADNIEAYGKYLPLRYNVVFGGVKINPQMQALRRGTDILVATPGRLLDLHNQNAIKFNQLEILVLDEADRMLDMGFIHDIRKIMALLPKRRQNLMFSATFSADIKALASTIVNKPVEVSVAAANSTADKVSQSLIACDQSRKADLLIHLINDNNWQQVLVFSRTKHGANKLATRLEKAGINAAAIHGNKSQGARTKALAGFKAGDVRVLVATDIAARGIDIHLLPHVVNVDLPHVPEDYVHRIGRTARAGSEGAAVSLVCADELKQLKDIERLIQTVLPRATVAGFEPSNKLPITELNTRPLKPNKPKRKKPSNTTVRKTGNEAGPPKQRRRKPRNNGNNQAPSKPSKQTLKY